MKLPMYQVDAFADAVFSGNSAAVVPLEEWLSESEMQNIAMENNLAETAFFTGADGRYGLRWFTPTFEIDLCGHATLATAFVIFTELGYQGESVVFETQSGELTVRREGEMLYMDFPARPPEPCEVPGLLFEALGKLPEAVLQARDLVCVYPEEEDVVGLKPDFAQLDRLDCFGVIATAPASNGDYDFVSRYFCPREDIHEDPVTGSAHCSLVPYWAQRLGKSELTAYQASQRGGFLGCRLKGDRVEVSGKAVLYMSGTIYL